MCGISAGATRTAITAHFAIRGNLADVAAKEVRGTECNVMRCASLTIYLGVDHVPLLTGFSRNCCEHARPCKWSNVRVLRQQFPNNNMDYICNLNNHPRCGKLLRSSIASSTWNGVHNISCCVEIIDRAYEIACTVQMTRINAARLHVIVDDIIRFCDKDEAGNASSEAASIPDWYGDPCFSRKEVNARESLIYPWGGDDARHPADKQQARVRFEVGRGLDTVPPDAIGWKSLTSMFRGPGRLPYCALVSGTKNWVCWFGCLQTM